MPLATGRDGSPLERIPILPVDAISGDAALGVTAAAGVGTQAAGTIPLAGGAGVTGTSTTAGGAGGVASLTGGAGGAKTGTGAAAGGAGATGTIAGGAGGATASSGSDAGGAGGSALVTGGTGGAASAGTGNGGAGGALTLTAGTGGNSAGGTGGAGGSIVQTPGAAGTGGSGLAGGNFLRSSGGLHFRQQTAATAKSDGAETITAAQMINGIVVFTVTTGRTLTTPTGAQISAACPASLAVGDSFDFTLITVGTGSDDIATLTAGDGNVTFVGQVTVGPDIGATEAMRNWGTWRFRNTGTSTWVGYRIG